MRVTIREIAEYLADFALFWPGVAISIAISLTLAGRVARRIGAARPTGALLVFSIGLIASATLTPSREALRFGLVGSGMCDLSRMGFAQIHDLLELDDPGFNVLLFIPLGMAIGLIPRSAIRLGLAVSALLLSPAIELVQLVVTPLDRACQSSDVFDNVTGLVVGLVLGLLIGLVARIVGVGPRRKARPGTGTGGGPGREP